MRKEGEHPVLKGIIHKRIFWVWCPNCNQFHTHGIGEGHRVAHCHDHSEKALFPKGYIIKEFTKRELQDMGLKKVK